MLRRAIQVVTADLVGSSIPPNERSTCELARVNSHFRSDCTWEASTPRDFHGPSEPTTFGWLFLQLGLCFYQATKQEGGVGTGFVMSRLHLVKL